MKYKIKNTDLFLNGKLIPEGTEITLDEAEAESIKDFLIPVEPQPNAEPKPQPKPNVESKQKSKKN
jgi:hypothetical protein